MSVSGCSSCSSSGVAYEASIAVAKKSLDVSKQQGAAALALLQAAVDFQKEQGPAPGPSANPNVGKTLDVSA
ncbi:MAG: putative motility protein [Phycisphaera sp.]|nr:putative motility protein [Phycisphaera sp.]